MWRLQQQGELSFLMRSLTLSLIILEGDSEIIAQALQNEDQSLASYGHLIKEARIYAEFFHSFRVFHFCL